MGFSKVKAFKKLCFYCKALNVIKMGLSHVYSVNVNIWRFSCFMMYTLIIYSIWGSLTYKPLIAGSWDVISCIRAPSCNQDRVF